MTDETFEYDGHLLFNQVLVTDVAPDFEFEEFIDRLPQYHPGVPESPGKGYERVDIRTFFDDDSDIDDRLKVIGDEFYSLRHKYEGFSVESRAWEEETHVEKQIDTVGIYWDYPEHLFIRGAKSDVKHIGSELRVGFDDEVEVSQLGFSPDFLLWVVYKFSNSEPLSPHLSAQRLTDSKLSGSINQFSSSNVIQESNNVTKSLSLILGLLQGHSITSINGEFEVEGYRVESELSSNGRVYIKSSRGDIRESSDFRRMLISLLFLKRISLLYRDWLNLSNKERYPPVEFFEDLVTEAKSKGVELTFSFNDLFRKYAKKRGEDVDDALDKNIVSETDDESIDMRSNRDQSNYESITNERIPELIKYGESETIEFKEDLTDYVEKIAYELVAFANYKGGILIFGVSDRGDVVGLTNPREVEERVTNMLSETVIPPLDPEIHFHNIDDRDLLIYRVKPFQTLPHSVDHIFYKRKGTTKQALTPVEVFNLMKRVDSF